MTWLAWVAIIGALLLLFAVGSAYFTRLPIATSALYLLIGVAIGPTGIGLVSIDLFANTELIEHVAELAVMFALFTGGLRLRPGLRDRAWRAAWLLAGPVMIASIAALALATHVLFGTPLVFSLLLAAILAPTDPVLASSVTVEDAADRDRVRFALSAEAGLNDGTAFPFVLLALGLGTAGAGSWLVTWAITKLVWAVAAALVLGYGLGRLVGKFAIHRRSRSLDTSAPNDFLALALIALAYAVAQALGMWGFLAVFAAGVGLRAAELRVVLDAPHPVIAADDQIANADHPPAEHLVSAREDPEALAQPAVAAGVLVSEVLSFGSTLERFVEIALVIAVGVLLVDHWDTRALPIAALLFVVIRPLVTVITLHRTDTTRSHRWLIGWFGVRGIGSLYYLAFALGHGADPSQASALVDLTISVVALSVVAHGVTAKPLLARSARSRD